MIEKHRDGEHGYWDYLIKEDKSATPQLEQLCLGLAEIICTLEPGPSDRLTPQKLASFYRSVGGNLDALFLRTSESALSFLYRTIGCYHSLEPSANPFETPSIPCLTPAGFVKWQTVQLLLCPDEHVGYLQEAVRIYDIPRPDGGNFPKPIPKEAFPARPDEAMERWHKQVTSQLNHENYMRRIKNSPYQSPQPMDRADGYFGPHVPRNQRPSKPSRQQSREDVVYSSGSRRSSEPDFASPVGSKERAHSSHAYSREDRMRSQSANRPGVGSRQRSATTHLPVRSYPPSAFSQRHGSGPPGDRPSSSMRYGQHLDRPPRYDDTRSHSGSSLSHTSADEASSEDSRDEVRRSRSRQSEGFMSSLLSTLPFTSRNRRCRSHDTSYRREDVPPPPPPRREDEHMSPPKFNPEPYHRPPHSVRFKEDMFHRDEAVNSAPDSPVSNRRGQPMPRSDPRQSRNPGLTEQAPSSGYNLRKQVSNDWESGPRSDHDSPARPLRSKAGQPLRVSTSTGVQGRRYANTDPNSAGPFSNNPTQQDRTRFSLAL